MPNSSILVGDAMSTPPIVVAADASRADVIESLLSNRVSGLPVVDAGGALIGIVTEADLVLGAAYGSSSDAALALVAEIIQGRPAPWVDQVHAHTACELMTREVATAEPGETVVVAARRMLRHRCKRLPVVDGGRVVGMISRRDVLDALYYGAARHERAHTVTELSAEECMLLLDGSTVGRVAYEHEGRPMILPVNYVMSDGMVVFRTDAGQKLDEIPMRRVAFEVDATHTNRPWSVVAHGHARDVTTALGAGFEALRRVPLMLQAPGEKSHWIVIEIAEVSGRRFGCAP